MPIPGAAGYMFGKRAAGKTSPQDRGVTFLNTVQAMVATAARHAPEDIALRALPSLGPLTVDPVAEVRRCITLYTAEDL